MLANTNSIPDEASSGVEYKVHGMFSSKVGARPFPDTFMFSARELKDAGLPKKRIKQVVINYHKELLEQGMGDLEEVSSDEEELEEGEFAAAMQQDGTVEPGGAASVEPGGAAVENAVVENAVV